MDTEKFLRQCDFSKQSIAHKEALRKRLGEEALTEEALAFLAAAGEAEAAREPLTDLCELGESPARCTRNDCIHRFFQNGAWICRKQRRRIE